MSSIATAIKNRANTNMSDPAYSVEYRVYCRGARGNMLKFVVSDLDEALDIYDSLYTTDIVMVKVYRDNTEAVTRLYACGEVW